MAYLLDTDWAIDALGGKRHAAETLAGLLPEGVAISWITIGEIYEGAFGYPDPATHLASIREFVRQLSILNLNDPIMERFAEIRSSLRRQGQIIPDFDIILGATALHHGLMVLIRNTRRFSRIPDLKLYAK